MANQKLIHDKLNKEFITQINDDAVILSFIVTVSFQTGGN